MVADDKKLRYKHLLGWRRIEYSKIKTITCEPYILRGRYSSTQCLRLYITTDIDECDMKEAVDTNKMLGNAMEGKLTELPLMRVYELVKKKSGK